MRSIGTLTNVAVLALAALVTACGTTSTTSTTLLSAGAGLDGIEIEVHESPD